MEKYFTLRLKVSEEDFNQIQEILNTLKKRGFKPTGGLSTQDILFVSLFKKITPQFKESFIEEHTPVDFFVKEALKEPSLRLKLDQFLKTNRKQKKQIKLKDNK